MCDEPTLLLVAQPDRLEGKAPVGCLAEAVAGHHLGLNRSQALFDPPRARSPGQARREGQLRWTTEPNPAFLGALPPLSPAILTANAVSRLFASGAVRVLLSGRVYSAQAAASSAVPNP